ncbi:MAG: hypothetical protein QOE70_1624 [Chthoniobacter sp.]|jgi:hypothetical protein|nr:hypothetical protein [Chthoniobacter sp.]
MHGHAEGFRDYREFEIEHRTDSRLDLRQSGSIQVQPAELDLRRELILRQFL